MRLLRVALTSILEWASLSPSRFNPFVYDAEVNNQLSLTELQSPSLIQSSGSSSAVAGVTFHPDGSSNGFQCSYPKLAKASWTACNTASSRNCWIRQKSTNITYDINTDYEAVTPPGQLREFWLDINEVTYNADGQVKVAKTYNGTYPGPKLEACWGDQLLVHLKNGLADQGSTMHLHGIRELSTPGNDGTPTTQCPISRGGEFTYNTTLTQYGHSWYHSHYSLQYADGLAGALVIYGPSSAPWDLAPEPMMMTDWVHTLADDRYSEEKAGQFPVAADSIVFNGKGRLPGSPPATSVTEFNVTRFTPGKKHLLRLINGAAGTTFVFSIDAHNLTVIAADFVPIAPFTTASLAVGIGQRYDVVVQGLEDPLSLPASNGNFWIRTHPADGCNNFTAGAFSSSGSPAEPFDVRTGVVQYLFANTTDAISPLANFKSEGCNLACADPPTTLLRPVVPWTIDRTPLNKIEDSTLYIAHETQPDTTLGSEGSYFHWMLRLDPHTEAADHLEEHSAFWIEFGNPTILNWTGLEKGDPHSNIIDYSSTDSYDGFLYMVIDTALLPGTTPEELNAQNTTVFPVTHPIHWHGSDVVILGQEAVPYDPKTSIAGWNFENPPRRDTITVPGGGYVAVAFKPDNPGTWLVHCHIAYHVSAGLALQMVIRSDRIDEILGDRKRALEEGCLAWEEDVAKGGIIQKDDAGV